MNNRSFIPLLIAACAVAALTRSEARSAPAALRQEASFRAATDLVSVYATVTDGTGRLVPNLTEKDFTVYDNGKAQPLTYFSNERQPFTVVVMLDRSGSMAQYSDLIRDAGITFVKQMLPNDRARIGSLGNRIVMEPPQFTGDQDVLIDVLRNGIENNGQSPVWAAIDRSISAVLPEAGRRVVLIFSDGEDAPAPGVGITRLEDLTRRVRLDDVMVYAVGFAVAERRSIPQMTPRPRTPWGFPPSGRFELAQSGGFNQRLKRPNPGLKALADASGGGYFEMDPSSDLNATFARVAEELHRQYWLGFTPQKLDGKEHELEVKVRGGLKVRATKSYAARPGN
ncbi:MAG: VWA domain-containing protein [Acidobacteriota bacterium]